MNAISIPQIDSQNYWSGTTEICCSCGGTIHWAEAAYVPGSRACDKCLVLFAVRGHGSERKLVPQAFNGNYIDDADPSINDSDLYHVVENYFTRKELD